MIIIAYGNYGFFVSIPTLEILTMDIVIAIIVHTKCTPNFGLLEGWNMVKRSVKALVHTLW
jgi:hypothetical protein